MKILIIPDIHTNFPNAEGIINKIRPDKVVFLGDYFDRFYETYEDTHNTAYWLQQSLKKKDRIHLIGNHDLNYMTSNETLKCGGYTRDKYNIVQQYEIQWDRMKLYCWVGDWLCTHAGLSDNFIKSNNLDQLTLNKILEELNMNLAKIDELGDDNIYLQAGQIRGGENEFGGIVWGDYTEFKDLDGLKQIFGHTPDKAVRRLKTEKSEHICLDTQGRNYAVYNTENNHMMVSKV